MVLLLIVGIQESEEVLSCWYNGLSFLWVERILFYVIAERVLSYVCVGPLLIVRDESILIYWWIPFESRRERGGERESPFHLHVYWVVQRERVWTWYDGFFPLASHTSLYDWREGVICYAEWVIFERIKTWKEVDWKRKGRMASHEWSSLIFFN